MPPGTARGAQPYLEIPSKGPLPPPSEAPRAPSGLLRVADVLVRTLGELGATTWYGIPGGSISPIYDALLDAPEARTVVARHETGAAFMAAGHARLTGELPVLLVTSGPGVTNALTGIASAWSDGTPMLVIGGEVARSSFGRGAVQEGSRYFLDVLSMLAPVTRLCEEITGPRAAASLVRKAVAAARSGRRGPAFLSLPLDVACVQVPSQELGGALPEASCAPDEALLQRAAELLSTARRPLIVLGNGARDPRSAHLLTNLAHLLDCPVITSPKAKGVFPESDPLCLGVFGLAGHPSASRYLEEGVDVMLAIGAGFGDTSTNGWSPLLAPRGNMIQIDIEPAQIGRNYHADLGLVGSSRVLLEQLLTRVRHRRSPTRHLGISRIAPETALDDSAPLKPQRLMRALQECFPEETVFTVDIGEHQLFALHYLSIDRPDAFILHSGLGAMGSGVCSAIGAKVAAPERPVVAICGDCGFQMFEGELATAVQHGVGVVFAILNDARPNMVVHGLEGVYGRGMPLDLPQVDFVKLAESVGALGYRVESVGDLQRVPEEARRGELGPVVLDIRIDASQKLEGSTRAAHLKQFTSGDPTP